HRAGQVTEPDVDELDVLIRDELEHLVGVAEHPTSTGVGGSGRGTPPPSVRPGFLRDVRRGQFPGGVPTVSRVLRPGRQVTSVLPSPVDPGQWPVGPVPGAPVTLV